jgi:hypothetical protein
VIHQYLLLFVFVFLVWWWFVFVLVVHCFGLLCVFDWDPEGGERKQQLLLLACICGFLFSFPVGTYCRCIVCDWVRVSVVVAGVGVGLKVCLPKKTSLLVSGIYRHGIGVVVRSVGGLASEWMDAFHVLESLGLFSGFAERSCCA